MSLRTWLRGMFAAKAENPPTPAPTPDDGAWAPFRWVDHDDGTASFVLDADEYPADAFERHGAEGSGHDWEALARTFLARHRPADPDAIDFDCEAGLFCVYAKDKAALAAFARAFRALCADEKALDKLLAATEWE